MHPDFSMAKKWTIQEYLWCGWLAILLCSAANTNTMSTFYLLNLFCTKVTFLQKLILFFARTLKALKVFLCFTWLLGAQKGLQNLFGRGGGEWRRKSFLSSQIFTGLEKSRFICIVVYEKKPEHLNFHYRIQWINCDFWGKIECYKGWVVISSAEVIAGWSNSHPHWGPSSTQHLNACLILITYISPAWP